MPLVDCGSFAVSATTATSIDLSRFNAIGDDPCEVKLANESPLTLQVTIGSDQHTLGAWIVDKYPLCGKTVFSVLPSQIQTPAPSGVPSSLLLVTVAPEGESIPGTFPAALPRMANVQSPQQDLGSLVVASGGSASGTFAVPGGAHAVGVLIKSGAGISQISIVGAQSGTSYLALPPFGATATLQGFVMSAALSAVDSQVLITATSSGGATLEVVAILEAAAEFVFNNPTQPLSVELVSVAAVPLGDVGAPTLAKDQGSETVTYAPGVITGGGVIASFKAAAGQTIAQVGSLGAFLVGSLVQVSPLFAQPTSAGSLLVCCVGAGTGEPTTAAAGWVKATSDGAFAPWSAIWYRLNCGAAEAPPVFTSAAGSSAMFAQLGEFSGADLAAALEQIGSAGSGGTSSLVLATAAVDAAFGDLVVMASRWVCNLNATPTGSFADSLNNSMSAVQMGNGFSTQGGATRGMSFSYGIVPAAVSALPLGITPWDYDATGTSAPAAGSTASTTLAASPGKRYRAHSIDAALISIAAVAIAPTVQLKDGTTVVWQQWLGLTAVAEDNKHLEKTGAAIPGTAGSSMTLTFSGGAANVAESVNLGAYLRS